MEGLSLKLPPAIIRKFNEIIDRLNSLIVKVEPDRCPEPEEVERCHNEAYGCNCLDCVEARKKKRIEEHDLITRARIEGKIDGLKMISDILESTNLLYREKLEIKLAVLQEKTNLRKQLN
jgi:hypothetical protein